MSIGADKKKKYDALAQLQADKELGFINDVSQNGEYARTNHMLQQLAEKGYAFLPSKKKGFAKINDGKTKEYIDCELDIAVFEGAPSTWQKVWKDMKNGVLDEFLQS